MWNIIVLMICDGWWYILIVCNGYLSNNLFWVTQNNCLEIKINYNIKINVVITFSMYLKTMYFQCRANVKFFFFTVSIAYIFLLFQTENCILYLLYLSSLIGRLVGCMQRRPFSDPDPEKDPEQFQVQRGPRIGQGLFINIF